MLKTRTISKAACSLCCIPSSLSADGEGNATAWAGDLRIPIANYEQLRQNQQGKMTKGDDDDALIGLVEICLEKPTGLLTPPLRPVDFVGLLPATKAKQGSGFQPYLCNLCIAEAGRRRGLGKLLCSICEEVLSTYCMHTSTITDSNIGPLLNCYLSMH